MTWRVGLQRLAGQDQLAGMRLEVPALAAPVANATLVLWQAEDVKPVANISDKMMSSIKGY